MTSENLREVSKKLTDPLSCDPLTLRWLALRLYLSSDRGGLTEESEVRRPLVGGELAEEKNQLDLVTVFNLKGRLIGNRVVEEVR